MHISFWISSRSYILILTPILAPVILRDYRPGSSRAQSFLFSRECSFLFQLASCTRTTPGRISKSRFFLFSNILLAPFRLLFRQAFRLYLTQLLFCENLASCNEFITTSWDYENRPLLLVWLKKAVVVGTRRTTIGLGVMNDFLPVRSWLRLETSNWNYGIIKLASSAL